MHRRLNRPLSRHPTDLVATDPRRNIVSFVPDREEWLSLWLTIPNMTVASDAMAGVGTDGKLLSWESVD
ncbi:hypothetical protein [Haloarchaeobius sp. DFWS5]|uniref:hypothetical protein n=1 Tax=Haloarchaeobius sp. DFWS5 TaxID=3446114 RepID=UPI003EBEA7D6